MEANAKICLSVCILMVAGLTLCNTNTVREDWEFVTRPTKYGDVRGYSVPFRDQSHMRMDVFAGVPYARPPVGDLRWRAPEEPDAWTGTVYNATDFSPCCPQDLQTIRDYSMGPDYNNTSEDCLYLNIHTPRNTEQPDQKFPVLIHIHGGSFSYGSGEEYDGEVLATRGVMHIGINYRLGIMGFLSTDDEEAAGNYGMLDCVLALRWIQENIEAFGGDPNSVTISGESSGGVAVSLLMFADQAQGLFHRAIPQSGAAVAPWAVYRPPLTCRGMAESVARDVNCPTSPTRDMLACMRTKDALALVDIAEYVQAPPTMESWYPRVDGDFLKDNPETLLAQGRFHKVPLFVGTVKNESPYFFQHIADIENGFSRDYKADMMNNRSVRYGDHQQLMSDSFRHEYNHPGDDYINNRDVFFELADDEDYIAPANEQATGHSVHVDDTYLYSFDHRSVNHPDAEWLGVAHGDELYYMYGTPFWSRDPCPWTCRNIVWLNRQNWTLDDQITSQRTMDTWINFARDGNPSSPVMPYWPVFEAVNQSYVSIDSEWKADTYFKYRGVHFWNVYKHQLLNATVKCAVDDVI